MVWSDPGGEIRGLWSPDLQCLGGHHKNFGPGLEGNGEIWKLKKKNRSGHLVVSHVLGRWGPGKNRNLLVKEVTF